MKNAMLRINFSPLLVSLAIIAMLLWQATLYADEQPLPSIDEKLVAMEIQEPTRDSGYTVGDLITRTVTLKVKKPYKLLDTSLPIVGYEKRYRGQVIGIELRNIKKTEKETRDETIYTIRLTYQVFTRNVVAKPAALPPEIVKVQGEKEVYSFRIPSWSFRVSPIAVFGEVKLESDMSPFRGPLLLDSTRYQRILLSAVAVLILAGLGLLYILGARTWLPRMGGPFARALRDLKKRGNTETDLQQAVSRVHQAFNLTAGQSVFSDTLDTFFASKPGFKVIRPEIEQFFDLSRHVFFEPNIAHGIHGEPLTWLLGFTRQCRDCERGLRPEKSS